MARIGLGRHGGGDDVADDPLDGLVNLFDLGLVLAVAFLVAGLSIGSTAAERSREAAATTPVPGSQPIQVPDAAREAAGKGAAVGTVYRLPDGTLVLSEE